MKRFIAAAAVALLAALAGCGIFGDTKPITQGVPPACKTTDPQTKAVTVNAICAAAFEAINQANVLAASIDRMVIGKLRAGIWTQAQAQPYYDQTGKLGEKLDEAMAIFGKGDYIGAQSRAATVKQLLLILEKQIAAQAARTEAPILAPGLLII